MSYDFLGFPRVCLWRGGNLFLGRVGKEDRRRNSFRRRDEEGMGGFVLWVFSWILSIILRLLYFRLRRMATFLAVG